MSESKTKIAPRFERRPDLVGGIRLQERDLEIIRLVYEYRFLDSEHIALLTGSSYQTTLRRLRKLFHNGFLDRPEAQQRVWATPQKLVYALANRGAEVLAERLAVDPGKIRWSRDNKRVKHAYLEHTLMVADFLVCLTLALRDRADSELLFRERESDELQAEVRFLDWRKKKRRDGREVIAQGRERRQPIVPDGFLSIEDKGDTLFFFLEADRGTMTNKRFLYKLKGYWSWWEQDGPLACKWWRERVPEWREGVKAFRVLTVTTSERRKENLRQIAKEADRFCKGSEMFWFTSKEEFDLAEPESILGPIWQTPKDDTRHHLLE